MVLYECIECNYNTRLKGDYIRHLSTKKHHKNMETKTSLCEKIPYQDSTKVAQMSTKNIKKHKQVAQMSTKVAQNQPDPIECEYCAKEFKTKANLRRHIRNYCQEKKKMDAESSIKDKQIEILQEQVSKLMDKVGNTTINNTQVHNKIGKIDNIQQQSNVQQTHNIQQNNNVQLNCFGKENLSMLTDDIKQEFIKGPFKMMPKLMEMIYFNKKYPENHNMKLVNKNKDIMKIKDKDGWKLVDKNETVDYILEDKNYEVDSYYDNNAEEFSQFVKKTYKNFRRLFDSRDKELWKQIKRDVDFLLWNNMEK
jgi:hypothetical protein